ncbi:hypothetical protein ACA910_010165 [Epithemia clementina (nom. ined.)]
MSSDSNDSAVSSSSSSYLQYRSRLAQRTASPERLLQLKSSAAASTTTTTTTTTTATKTSPHVSFLDPPSQLDDNDDNEPGKDNNNKKVKVDHAKTSSTSTTTTVPHYLSYRETLSQRFVAKPTPAAGQPESIIIVPDPLLEKSLTDGQSTTEPNLGVSSVVAGEAPPSSSSQKQSLAEPTASSSSSTDGTNHDKETNSRPEEQQQQSSNQNATPVAAVVVVAVAAAASTTTTTPNGHSATKAAEPQTIIPTMTSEEMPVAWSEDHDDDHSYEQFHDDDHLDDGDDDNDREEQSSPNGKKRGPVVVVSSTTTKGRANNNNKKDADDEEEEFKEEIDQGEIVEEEMDLERGEVGATAPRPNKTQPQQGSWRAHQQSSYPNNDDAARIQNDKTRENSNRFVGVAMARRASSSPSPLTQAASKNNTLTMERATLKNGTNNNNIDEKRKVQPEQQLPYAAVAVDEKLDLTRKSFSFTDLKQHPPECDRSDLLQWSLLVGLLVGLPLIVGLTVLAHDNEK